MSYFPFLGATGWVGRVLLGILKPIVPGSHGQIIIMSNYIINVTLFSGKYIFIAEVCHVIVSKQIGGWVGDCTNRDRNIAQSLIPLF